MINAEVIFPYKWIETSILRDMSGDLSWSFKELKDSMPESQRARLNTFCDSFDYKFRFSEYHAARAISISESYHNRPKVVLGGDEFAQPFFEYEGHIIAFMTILHSTGDTFGQILNICLNNSLVHEERVSLRGMQKYFSECPEYCNWGNELKTFLESAEFRYLDGFVNTLKHRHLLKQEWTIEQRKGGLLNVGFRFDAFKYRNEEFLKKWGKDLIDLKVPIRENLIRLGRKINQSVLSLAQEKHFKYE